MLKCASSGLTIHWSRASQSQTWRPCWNGLLMFSDACGRKSIRCLTILASVLLFVQCQSSRKWLKLVDEQCVKKDRKTMSYQGISVESGVAVRRSADDRRGYSLSTRRFTPSAIKWKRWLQNKVDLNDCGCGAPGVTMFVCCVIKSPLSSAVKKHLILTLTVILLALGSQYQYAKYRD